MSDQEIKMPQGMISYQDFQRLVCTSAQQYYDFLTDKFEHGLLSSGNKVISVTAVAHGRVEGEYTFFTSEKVTHPDFCHVYILGEYKPTIRIITVAGQKHLGCSIRVIDGTGILSSLPELLPEDITLVSDLRFLVKKIFNFYRGNQLSFSPPSPTSIPPLSEEYMAMLSDDQKTAVDKVFSSPISYISGAPGTGKTQAVLSRCILRYIRANKRVFLLAPTNNAVEQMLRGILPILKGAGISLNSIYRLGSSSAEFAADYPQVIGDINLEKLLEELLTRKQYCLGILDSFSDSEKQLNRLLEKQAVCIDAHSSVLPLYLDLKRSLDETLSLSSEIEDVANTVSSSKELLDSAKKARETAEQQVKLCQESIAHTRKRISSLRLYFWKKSEKMVQEDRLSQLMIALSHYQTDLTASLSAEHSAQESFSTSDRQLARLRLRHKNQLRSSSDLTEQILNISLCDADYHKAIKEALSFPAESDPVALFFSSLDLGVTKLRDEISSHAVDSARAEIADIEKRLSSLSSDVKYQQKKEALILAGTIESSLSDLSADESRYLQKDSIKGGISHVFLDEAGYTALAKAMVAFAPGAPVTFLGDHKQLPPVCEMNKISPEYKPVCLWALPVSYISELMNLPFDELYAKCYCKASDPSFSGIAYHALNTSYRFGQSLADILSKYIYAFPLKGAATDSFEIEVIDAPYTPGPEKRTSKTECEVIRNYLASRPDLDAAILSPYRNQVKYLRRCVPPEYQDHVLTVHRSQGREWDVIILSVVDTDSPYFTDTSLPIGRSVLNTAISRAKKRLVLVCDEKIWSEFPQQMIEEMIRIGKKHSSEAPQQS